ncbi:MAG TPA: AsmA family protein [Candidatus Sulfotelmatobacter sp.]|nr:AsmA family protein [Candidatus Sulfotelmatobacter sp.]
MKTFLKVLAIIIGLLIIAVIVVPFFIDANTFRPKLESELTDALGRQVKVGNLSLALWSGSVAADNISIADDPQFSSAPFVQAKSLKVGVELLPLILSKTLNIRDITLDQPQISLVKSENGERWNFSSLGGKNPSAPARPSGAASSTGKGAAQKSPNTAKPSAQDTAPAEKSTGTSAEKSSSNPMNLSIGKLNVNHGRVNVSRADSTEPKRVYNEVNISIKNFSFSSSFPFEMTANLPAGGNMKLTGTAGPIDVNDAALTPLNAKISVQNMNLAASGFIDPAAGIQGIADLNGTVVSNGNEAKANGTLTCSKLQVVKKGSPAPQPVKLDFTVVHNLAREVGNITRGDVSMGKAVAHLTGTYDAHGKVTSVNLKLNGQNMPVDDLQAMLPAVGVILPPKATLKGGDLDVNMASSGPVDRLVSTGAVKLQNTQLANFNLGQKMAAISALAGKNTGNDTTIQNFSSDVKMAPQGTEASNINLTVPAIGVLTGGGNVSPNNELAFKMNAQVGGMGIPFGITGTTSDPKFTPDVKGLATGFLQGALKNQLNNQNNPNQQPQDNPINSVMGLFKKKPQQQPPAQPK